MSVRRALAGVVVLGLAACAPRGAALLPAPPPHVRKEPPSPGPESFSPALAAKYAEAIRATRGAIARGAWEAAIPSWKELEGGPLRDDAIFHQGVLRHLGGDPEGAVEQYRRITGGFPVFEPAAANLLGIFLMRGNRAEARSLVARILPDPSSPPPGMLPELQANAAAVLAEEGRLEEAARLIEALRERGYDDPAFRWNRAVLAYREGNLSAARELAGTVPAETAGLWPVTASRYAWNRGEDRPRAPDGIAPEERRMAELARNLEAYGEFRNGNPAAAEAILAAFPHGAALPAELETNLGILRAELGNWEEARGHFERAVSGNPSLPEGWLNLGIFLEVFAGEPDGAKRCYENYLRVNGPRREEVRSWLEGVGRSAP